MTCKSISFPAEVRGTSVAVARGTRASSRSTCPGAVGTVTVNPDSQFHFVTNLYAGDAAVLPNCGSANPVMNGVAIRRRLARRLVPEGDAGQPLRPFVQYPPPASPPPTGTLITLFDGTPFAHWRI